MVATMGQEVAAGGPEKGAEPPSRRVGFRQITTLDQVGEEPLYEVARLVSIETLSTGIRIEGIPVIPAKMFQSLSASPIGRVASPKDPAPVSRRESGGRKL